LKNKKNAAAIGIIGGADGPVAVFGGGVELPLRMRLTNGIRQCMYRRKRKCAEKKITAGTHTLEETIEYAKNTYGLAEAAPCAETTPSVSRSFEIKTEDGLFRLEINDATGGVDVSYSCVGKTAKRFEKIAKDIYLYYGVSEEDIRNKTERYHSLVTVLST